MKDSLQDVFLKIFIYSLIPFVMIVSFNITANIGGRKYKKQNIERKQQNTPQKETKKPSSLKTGEIKKNTTLPSYVQNITPSEMEALNKALNYLDKEKINDPKVITEVFLQSMGYPKNIVDVKYFDPQRGKTNYMTDTRMGSFNLMTGDMEINSIMTNNSNVARGELIAVLRHELDHFDKTAKVCKAIGFENYKKLFNSHPDFNEAFWKNANGWANTSGFNHKKFLNSMMAQTDYYDPTSLYDTFTTLTHGARSQLEITAYAFSDYIEERYSIRNKTTSLKKLANIFNELDWDIYNLSTQSKYIAKSRSAIFDYFFVLSMMDYNPQFKTAYQEAFSNKDVSYLVSLYSDQEKQYTTQGLDENKIKELGKIFHNMEVKMNTTLTQNQINDILYLKYLTLRYCAKTKANNSNLGQYAILLDINTDDYIAYLDIYGTKDDELYLELLAVKLQLANVAVDKGGGKTIKLGEYGEMDRLINKIEKNNIYKRKMKESGKGKNEFAKEFIEKNKIF